MVVQDFLKSLLERRETLGRDDAHALMAGVFAGAANEVQLAALLGALAARGETPAEVAGFVDAMRAAVLPFPIGEEERKCLVDSCGTGGDLSGTFNISTAAGLVAAAAGATVAKHGNRAVTSQCGSADVLAALGIPTDLTAGAAVEALRVHRFAFLHAPSMHPALKAVMPIRRALGVRTVFNILGPLANPAGAQLQVMGVYSAHLAPLVAEVMVLLGTRRGLVVHGHSDTPGVGMDELSISGESEVAEVREGVVTRWTVTPEEFGLERAPLSALAGGDALANAATLRSIFAGEPGPRRDVVVLNAAAVIMAAGLAETLGDGVGMAQRTIDSGAVTRLVASLDAHAGGTAGGSAA